MDQSNVVTKQTGPRPPTKPANGGQTTAPIAAVPKIPKKQFPVPEFKGERGESVIPKGFRHLLFVTGFRGFGKTHLLCSIDNPANLLFLDYESKGESVAYNLGIDNYFSVCDDAADLYGTHADPIKYYERTMQIIEAIPQGRFTTLILDNASYLQKGAISEAAENPHLYFSTEVERKNAISGAHGGAWGGVKSILNGLFRTARARGIEVIGTSFQLTGAWQDGKPLWNKWKTTDVAFWHEMSVCTLVLVPGKVSPPIPAALVMKEQLARAKWCPIEKRTKIQRCLPFKMPIADMWNLYNYLEHPADFVHPREDETPTREQMEMYEKSFSKEQLSTQLRMVEASIKLAELQAKGIIIDPDAPEA